MSQLRREARSHLRTRSMSRLARGSRTFVSVAVVAIAWQLIGRYVIKSDLVFAPLSDIAVRFIELVRTGELWRDVCASGLVFVSGYVLAVLLGVALGILLAVSPRFSSYVEPWLSALYATPMIALAPIFIVLLGIGWSAKVLIIFIEAFFPIAVNTALGIRSTDQDLIDASKSFGADSQQITRTVLLPYAAPFIVGGMRIAVARALSGVFVAEIFGSVAGIGNMIWFSAQSYDTPKLFVGVFILAGTSILLMSLLSRLERIVAPWRK
jgi:ABC-type nitrate/sulfonate/bicarbonate transport system permease component